MMAGIRLALLLAVWLSGSMALAHKPSDSYLRITSGDGPLSIQWDISLRDLEFLIGLDANRDSEITWGEVKAQQQAIAAHALSRLRISVDGQTCELKLAELLVTQHSDGGYVVLALETGVDGAPSVLSIDYNLLFDVDPTHRGLVLFTDGQSVSTHILSPGKSTVELRSGEGGLWHTFADFVAEGVWHIWIGFDHILFLLSLLLPAVLVRSNKQWQAVETFRPAFTTVLKIVTVFTVAHSITLWLAVMDYVTLPARLVESTIALSIVVTALNNLYPVLPFSGWVIAFVFGLVHGFGFANVLLDLGLSDVALAVSLLGFNVGVELGQIAIVLVFLPLAFLMRGTPFYRWVVFFLGSVVIAIIGILWAIERVFDVTIFGG
jgi:hypothetical protein